MRHKLLFCGFLLTVFLLAILSFSSGISSEFYLDDRINLEPLRGLEKSPGLLKEVVSENRSGLLGRYVSVISFSIDVILWGYGAVTFKVVNVVLHLFNSVLVYFFARRVLKWMFQRSAGESAHKVQYLALSITALWVLSPMMVSTVLYPVQRMTILSSIFCLSGMLFYINSRSKLGIEPVQAWIGIWAVVLVFLPAAAFSKENGLLLPLYLLLIEATFFRFKCNHKISVSIIIYFIALLAIPCFFLIAVYPEFLWSLISYTHRDFTANERLLSESRILLLYIKSLVFPSAGGFGLFHDDITISKSLTSPISTLYSLIVWAGGLTASVISIVKNKLPLVGFGVLLFVSGHLMESTVIGLELYFEHRNYLPSIGIYISLVCGVWYFFSLIHQTKYMWLLVIGMSVLFSFITWQQAKTWANPELRIIMDAENHPGSPRALLALSGYYANEGFLDESYRVLNDAVALNSKLKAGVAIQRAYSACINRFPIPESVFLVLESGVELGYPEYVSNILNELNLDIRNSRCYIKDHKRFAEVLSNWVSFKDISSWEVETRLAETLLNLGYIELAKKHLLRVWQVNRSSNDAPLLLIELYLMADQVTKAEKVLFELDRNTREYKLSEKARLVDIRRYLNNEK